MDENIDDIKKKKLDEIENKVLEEIEKKELEEIKKRKLEKMINKISEPLKPEVVFPEKPVIVTDSSINQVVKGYPLVIVDCWAEWCGPCRMIAPVIDELSRAYKGSVVFAKLNVDENMQTARNYKITAIPLLLVFKNGTLIDKLVGAYPKPMLERKIRSYL